MRTHVVALGLWVGAGVLSFAQVCAADTSIETGTSWGVSRNNGASYITPPTSLSNRTLPDGDQVTGIFEGNPSAIFDNWYRITFPLNESVLSASAHFSTDDLFELLVNDQAVPGVIDDIPNVKNSSPVTGLSIPASFFVAGQNEIIFKTQMVDGDPFLAARIDITSVPEPASALLLAAGGLLLARRRRAAGGWG